MTEYSIAELKELIGDKVPPKGSLPAAWWLTTDPDQIAAYDRWLDDYENHKAKVAELCDTLGVEITDVMISSWGKVTTISGFRSPHPMRLWSGHPDHQAPPPGWRVDKKTDYLVPIRRTKKDRESEANKALDEVRRLPNVRAYLAGLPTEICLDDRDFGGTIYGVNYRRGASCVWAYSGGDPDRDPEKRANSAIDTDIWHRQRLSTLIALIEESAA